MYIYILKTVVLKPCHNNPGKSQNKTSATDTPAQTGGSASADSSQTNAA